MRVTLKKLLKKIHITEVNFCCNERLRGAVVTGQIRFRLHDLGPTIQAERNLLV